MSSYCINNIMGIHTYVHYVCELTQATGLLFTGKGGEGEGGEWEGGGGRYPISMQEKHACTIM